MGSGTAPGVVLHSAWALTTGGVPRGLVAHIAWARDPATRGQSARRKQLPMEEKASVGSRFSHRGPLASRRARPPCS
jgi:molybdopterin-biosynthesis enzyme MoeA-like protein